MSERELHPPLSPNTFIYGSAVSVRPDGGRLLWTTRTDDIGHSSWGVGTSDLDGSHEHDLGTAPVPLAGAEPARYHDERFGAEWMPDGKTICFAADGALYTIEDR